MQKIGYMTRLSRVLQQRAGENRRKEHRGLRIAGGAAVALCGAVACFFLLKAATLAYFGTARFEAMSVATGDRNAGVQFWLTGIDPVTRVLAETLSPGVTGHRGG